MAQIPFVVAQVPFVVACELPVSLTHTFGMILELKNAQIQAVHDFLELIA